MAPKTSNDAIAGNGIIPNNLNQNQLHKIEPWCPLTKFSMYLLRQDVLIYLKNNSCQLQLSKTVKLDPQQQLSSCPICSSMPGEVFEPLVSATTHLLTVQLPLPDWTSFCQRLPIFLPDILGPENTMPLPCWLHWVTRQDHGKGVLNLWVGDSFGEGFFINGL